METGNFVMIALGAGLVISGPLIIFKTVKGVMERRQADPNASLNLLSNGLNFVIALIFFLAGILFIMNNLRGNPLDA